MQLDSIIKKVILIKFIKLEFLERMGININIKESIGNNPIEISVIIPCRNEEKYIKKCLNSIIKQNIPMDKIEVLVIDGMSEDNTRKIVMQMIQKHPHIKLFENPSKIVPTALNIGIKHAKGKIVVRMDAHIIYKQDYILKCLKYLSAYDIGNVGGICITIPGDDSLISKSIAITLSHPFGVGNAYFRIGLKEPKYVDTVPFGCYRKEIFKKVGLFNENLVRNQDIEFNLRLKNAGEKVLLVPDIISYYYARSTLHALAKNNFLNGFWILYSTRFAKMPFSVRHLIPFFFLSSLCGSLILSIFYKSFLYLFISVLIFYLILDLFFACGMIPKKGYQYFFPIGLSFFTLHFSYGLGSICGMFKIIFEQLENSIKKMGKN